MVNGSQVSRSTDAGVSWSPISALGSGGSYFTRLSDNSLLLAMGLSWIRSTDDGRTWSSPTSFGLPSKHTYEFGPVIETSGGRWAYCPYYQDDQQHVSHPYFMWSSDRGKTWSAPVSFPVPSDGNTGLHEPTIAQIGPHKYVAAIRGDEGPNGPTPQQWDAFYLSYSQDGLNWTAPEPTAPGERGRMPLFYHIDNQYWLLSYREYVATGAGTQYATVRLSRDGKSWSQPHRFMSGVEANGFFVKSKGKWYLFASTYPGGEIVRQQIDLDALAKQLLPPAPEPSTRK